MYFELDVFCLFEARDPEFDPQPLPLAVEMFSIQCRLNTATNHVTTEYTECWPDFFIFCSISIILLASLVAGRRPKYTSGAD